MTIDLVGERAVLLPDGDGPGGEELLDVRRRRARPAPGWLVLGGVLLVLAGVLVAAQLGRHGRSAHSAVAGTSGPRGVPLAAAPGMPVPDSAPGVELDGRVFVVLGRFLLITGVNGSAARTVPLPNPDDEYALFADPARHRVWLVQRAPLRVDVYRSTGVLDRTLVAGGAADGLALLDGELYVAGSAGVRRIVFSGSVLHEAGARVRPGELIVADPARHRLLFVDHAGVQTSVRAQHPDRANPDGVGSLPLNTTYLVAAGPQLWVAGYDATNSAVLERLDAGTLRPVARSVLEQRLPGVLVAAANARELFVRSVAGGEGLWCVDARTGAVRQSWPDSPGAVAVGPDGSYVVAATDGAPRRLTDATCGG